MVRSWKRQEKIFWKIWNSQRKSFRLGITLVEVLRWGLSFPWTNSILRTKVKKYIFLIFGLNFHLLKQQPKQPDWVYFNQHSTNKSNTDIFLLPNSQASKLTLLPCEFYSHKRSIKEHLFHYWALQHWKEYQWNSFEWVSSSLKPGERFHCRFLQPASLQAAEKNMTILPSLQQIYWFAISTEIRYNSYE